MSEHQFETILMEITHPDTVDAWRLQFVQAMCKCAFFSTEQVKRAGGLPWLAWPVADTTDVPISHDSQCIAANHGVCDSAWFTQAARMLPCFEWSKDKVEAIIRLFGRITDTENMNNITAILTAGNGRPRPVIILPVLQLLLRESLLCLSKL